MEKLSTPVLMTMKNFIHYAIQSAHMPTMVLAPYAGKAALMVSKMLAFSALNKISEVIARMA